MTITDLIKRKLDLNNEDLKLTADQLRDPRELSVLDELQLSNRRLALLKARTKLLQDLEILTK